MLEEMAVILPDFGGTAAHTRCFLHTVNLVAKSLLRQFDEPKSRDDDHEKSDDDEPNVDGHSENERMDSDVLPGDDVDGFVDETEFLTHDARKSLQQNIRPVQLVLVKVCTLE